MALFKRGEVYYYEFELYGQRYKKSTRCRNKEDAKNLEAAARLKIINDRAGIQSSRTAAPTLMEFRQTFLEWVNSASDNEYTRAYHRRSFDPLLRFPKMGDTPIDKVDEPLIEAFKMWALKNVTNVKGEPVAKDTINRYLAALRKALRYAHRKLKLIDKVPVFEMYGQPEPTEYVFTDDEYEKWVNSAPELLKSASVLARWSGICRGEMLALQKDSVNLLDQPDCDGFYGEIEVRRGLKRKCRRRTLKLNREMRDALQVLMLRSRCHHVFTSPENPAKPLVRYTLDSQVRRMKAKGGFHTESGVHALRHTFLTEMGELTDPYTLQRIAGHSNITTTMRYVHPQKKAMQSAFRKLFGKKRTNDAD